MLQTTHNTRHILTDNNKRRNYATEMSEHELLAAFVAVSMKTLDRGGAKDIDTAIELGTQLEYANLKPHMVTTVKTVLQELENAGPELIMAKGKKRS